MAAQGRLQVVLDTNQWGAHTLLRSHLSASLIFLIEQRDALIVVPGVVKREVHSHLHATYERALAEMKGSLSRIRMILGEAPEPEFAAVEAVDVALETRLEELGSLVEVLEHDERHHVEAGEMVLTGLVPNGKRNQQYKDC